MREEAFDALIAQRFVTPHRAVQETEVSCGRGVVANFCDKDFKLADGKVVKARDYVTFQKTGNDRTYSVPPCPNGFQQTRGTALDSSQRTGRPHPIQNAR
jgi:hypothetical protein